MLWVLGAIVVYVAIVALIAWVSIHPYRIPFFISPGSLGAPQEDVEFKSADGTILRGWWVPNDQARTVTVWAHGYMMNRSELTPEAHTLWKRGAACLLFDFRSHGRSGNSRCSMGVSEAQDVRAAVEFVRSRCPDARVVLIGSSMGSAAIALAMAENPDLADAIVLDSAYSRLPSAILGWWRFVGGSWLSVALSPMPLLAWPMTGINPFRIDLAQSLPKLGSKPVLFFHGRIDRLALPLEAERNHAATSGPKEIVWFEGCGHSEGRWLQPEKYRDSLVEFLETHCLL